MELPKKNFEKGQLVTFNPCRKSIDRLPFLTSLYENKKWAVYEKVDLEDFPSWNDFSGQKIYLERGDTCIVLGVVGFPGRCFRIVMEDPSIDLNLYSVLLNGKTVQIFGCDLEKSAKQDPQ